MYYEATLDYSLLFDCFKGEFNQATIIVEEQGIVFWTRVQLPSSPLKSLEFSRLFLFGFLFANQYFRTFVCILIEHMLG